MVEQHEQQHVETMLATHQLRDGEPLLGTGAPLPPGGPLRARGPGSVLVPAGPFTLGVDARHRALARSTTSGPPTPSTCRPSGSPGSRSPTPSGSAFVDAGATPSRAGGRPAAGRTGWRPGWSGRSFWSADGSRRRFGLVEEIPADEPVQHVCFFEAEAYAAWAGARLPTEQEWEKACAWDPELGRRRRWPWGDSAWTPALANLGGDALRPAPVGAYPAGASAYGCEQLMGDVWEWTSSGLEPWPGFTADALRRLLARPSSAATTRSCAAAPGRWAAPRSGPSFRNWDLPIRRQIFCGLRLAWDVV